MRTLREWLKKQDPWHVTHGYINSLFFVFFLFFFSLVVFSCGFCVGFFLVFFCLCLFCCCVFFFFVCVFCGFCGFCGLWFSLDLIFFRRLREEVCAKVGHH